MKFNNKSMNPYHFAKDIQRLEDQMQIQELINRQNRKSHRVTGLAFMTISLAGYILLDWICKLENRIKALEEKKEEKMDEE